MNRIELAITRIQKRMTEFNVPADYKEPALNMKMDEFCRFQDLKSLAVANGVLSVEEGMTVYNLLGNLPSVFNSQPYAEKVALTNLFSELLKAQNDERVRSRL